ncbi:MAG TPA: hypothetical protein VE800_07200 [Actinomycetota bacterium]|jgi:hypothetical protein|nr:hypothetical protein [Actinomycetota bacterium]
MDQPPASPERSSPADRDDDDERRRALWLRIGAGVAVLALLVVAGIFLLGDGGPGVGPGEDLGPTGFSFELKRAKASPVTEQMPVDLQDVADEAAEAVKATMDHFYFGAYVNRDAWGSYEEAFALLQDPAASNADADTDVLTIGTTASEDYESVEEPAGTLNVLVLTNEEDVAISAIARVVFRMDAQLAAGGTTRITSTGSYFLRPGDEAWEIFAYSVDRNEEGSAVPSATAEPQ